jgi:phage tail sheath protein FI
MVQITQAGTLNTTALVVPDLYVQVVPPQQLLLNGVASNIIGIVGSASWGPVNQSVVFGGLAELMTTFGPPAVRKFDLGTQVATASAQGAAAFVGVRVTDGTDVAASYALLYASTNTYPALLTAQYTGTRGNQIAIDLESGSRSSTWRLVLSMPGSIPEVFDNIDASSGAPAFWNNLVSAVNSGIGALRGPSQIMVASLGNGTSIAPSSVSAQTLLGGTDGAANVTAQTLVGTDGTPRIGMFALRGQGCAIGLLADADTNLTWTSQVGFGLSEGVYMILTGPAGDTVSRAVSDKYEAGIDSFAAKVMFGDWLAWYDQTNQQTRLVSPQGFTAGRLATLAPCQSSLNKPLVGVIGSQRSGVIGSSQTSTYATAELQTLFGAGIDVICNPAPGGNYWAVRCGHNSASNAAVCGDSYTRLTNYIASTLAAGMGGYVGQLINQNLFSNIRATLLAYLGNLLSQGILGSADGSTPYAVQCDASNNPQSRTAVGYVQADVQVKYQGINEKFLVNLQGGAGVVVTSAAV